MTPTETRDSHIHTQRAPTVKNVAGRVLDVLVVLLLLPVAVIVGVCVALSVIIDSPGPVLYRARRVGRGGRDFEMLKFRTMTRDTQGSGLRVKNDVRQTPLGRMLSLSRLDELPQLWNVVRGEMGLVGPRPEIREFVEERPQEYAEILSVRPGMTGPTQLEFLDERVALAHVPATVRREFYVHTLLPDKVASDLRYVRQRTITGDAKVLVRTAFTSMAGPDTSRHRRSLTQVACVGVSAGTLAVIYGALLAAPVA